MVAAPMKIMKLRAAERSEAIAVQLLAARRAGECRTACARMGDRTDVTGFTPVTARTSVTAPASPTPDATHGHKSPAASFTGVGQERAHWEK